MNDDIDLKIARINFGMNKINNLLIDSEIKVPVHLAFGHEAIAAALISAKQDIDGVFLPHRNIHYQLAAEVDVDKVIDEILLKDSGVNSGFSGAMNMYNAERNIVYSSSILGNNLAVAIGYAKGMKVNNLKSVTWVVTGDGAIEEGAWYEAALNATSLGLQCIFVVENNEWSLATSVEQRRINFDLAEFAKFLDVSFLRLSGDSARDYQFQLTELRENSLKTGAPAIVEVILETKGGYTVVENAISRYVNYHAGALRNSVGGK
jgi:TPP-dependent pyruvate/acetoin dehydrogenase alpha subunit